MNQQEFRECVLDFESGLEIFDKYCNQAQENLPYEDFKTWFEKNVEWFYNGYELTHAEYDDKGKFVAGNCFGNAASIFLTDERYEYYEGFVHVLSRPNEAIRHGFNARESHVSDFTYFDEAGIEPVYYCGIRISKQIIEEGIDEFFPSLEEYIQRRRQQSFLVPYFGREENVPHLFKGQQFYHPSFD